MGWDVVGRLDFALIAWFRAEDVLYVLRKVVPLAILSVSRVAIVLYD